MASGDSLIFQVLRPLLLWGVRINPVLRQLEAQPEERILDVGCGYGYLAKPLRHCQYTGLDLDPRRIDWAKRHFGENSNRKFFAADISHSGLRSKSFDKAVAFGLLHHLPDETAVQCVQELTRIVKKRIIFLDSVYSRFHILNNLLCKLDQGKYVRRDKEYLSLVSPHVPKTQGAFYHAHSGIAKYFMMTCDLDPGVRS